MRNDNVVVLSLELFQFFLIVVVEDTAFEGLMKHELVDLHFVHPWHLFGVGSLIDLLPDVVPVVLLDDLLLWAVDFVFKLELLFELLKQGVALELDLDLDLVVRECLSQVRSDTLDLCGRAFVFEGFWQEHVLPLRLGLILILDFFGFMWDFGHLIE